MAINDVPIGWDWASLREIGDVVRHQVIPSTQPRRLFNYLSIENVESNTGRLVNFSPTPGNEIRSPKLAFTTQDVLYSRLRPYLNKVHLPTFEGISATDLLPIRPRAGISREFLAYFLRTQGVVEYAKQRMRGIQLPRLTVDDLGALSVPVPPSAEQERIATKLGQLCRELDLARSALQKVPPTMKKFHQSVLAMAFREGLANQSVNGDQDGSEHEDGLGGDSAELPRRWRWTSLGKVAVIIMGQSPPSSSYNRDKMGLPFFQGKADFGDLHPSPRIWCFSPKKIAEPGDVLISVRAPVGPTNLCKERACIGRGLAAVRPLPGIPPEYLLYFIRSAEQKIAKMGMGTTFTAISRRQLESLSLPLAPREEQRRIVSEIQKLFSEADLVSEIAKDGLGRCSVLERTILGRAFRGELVPQDSNDEPASELLSRVRALGPVQTGRRRRRPSAN
jgi:type I restriction enzyme, S subunit